MSIGNSVLNLMYGNPLTGLTGGPAALPGNRPTGGSGGPSGQTGPMTPPGQAGAPSGAPSVSQTPSPATQSPPDLMNLYLQLAQRQRSANEIDRGLSMMAASMSTPDMARAIMSSSGGGQGGGMGMDLNTLMQLQMMQHYANMPAPAGISDATWSGLLPADRAKAIQEQAAGQIGAQTKLNEAKQADVLEAQQKAPGAIDQFKRADDLANQIMSATETNGSNVMQNITSSALKRNAAQAMIDAQTSEPGKAKGSWTETAAYYLANLSDAEKATINNAIQLNGMVYGEQFANAGSRRTQAEIKGLQSGASQLLAFNQPFSNYQKQFGEFQNKLHTSIANAYGESGQLDQIPETYRWDQSGNPLVNQEYRPGGPLYAGGGGDWLKNPPKKEGSPAPPGFDYGAIKSGDTYTAPDGTIRRKS